MLEGCSSVRVTIFQAERALQRCAAADSYVSSGIVRRLVRLELRDAVGGVDSDTEKIGREQVKWKRNGLRAEAGNGVVIECSLPP